MTEIYDYLRLLYARIGVPHCPQCGREIHRQSIDQMVDHSASEETEAAFRATALEQPGVEGVELLRTRMFGNRVYVDLEIAADPDLTLAAAHGIAERVHDAIEQTYPDVKHIMVHVNPAKEQKT